MNSMTKAQMRYLYLTVFISGMATLAIELSASRLLGSTFGTGNLVWASIIGLILIYLTAGYFLGGRLADRRPSAGLLYQILCWGGFTAGLVPLAAGPVLSLAADAFDQLRLGELIGSFAVVLVLLIIPVTLLGMVSPFAIRLAITDPARTGSISGRIYGISTLGSFIGTFLPSLILIPIIGTHRTFTGLGLLLVLTGLAGLWLAQGWKAAARLGWMALVLAIVYALWGGRAIKNTAGQIYETESAYNYIQVLEVNGYRILRLNEGQGVHSVWHPTILNYYGPWEQFLSAPFFNPPPQRPTDVRRIAIIGLAAGTLAHQASIVYGPVPIDGYEIDGEIIAVGEKFFDMNQPNLNAIAQDGRWGLQQSVHKYSLIAVDAYRPPYIPWHLTTAEFFQLVYDRLEADGVMAINVGRSPTDRSLIDGLVGTISSVFPSIYVMDVPDSFNSIVFATRQPTEINNLYRNLADLPAEAHPLLRESLQRTVVFLQPTPQSSVVYTDDVAPIEWVTNNLVLSFLMGGGAEELP